MTKTDTSKIPADDLTGKALDEEAARLDIEGRGSMTADEKRAAVAAARDVPSKDDHTDDELPVRPGMESGAASTSHGPHGFISGFRV